MKWNSVRTRLTLLNMAVLAIVLLVLLVAVHYAVRGFMLTTIDRQLARRANMAAEAERHVRMSPELRTLLQQHLPHVMPHRTFRAVRLFDAQGHALNQLGQPASGLPPAWDARAYALSAAGQRVYSTVPEEETALRVFSAPIQHDGHYAGVIQVAYPLEELDHLLDGLMLILLVLSPFALLLAGLGGVFLADRALHPVRQITHAAEEIEADNLSRRLPVIGADEFSHLAVTFNGMIARLETAFAQLAESVEQERRFTADASHELRTPLTTIKAHTSLALRGERSPETYRKALKAIDGAADLMTQLVQDLLLLARSDSGQLALDCQPISLQELVDDTIELAHHEGQAPIHVAIAEPALTMHGDPHHLTRLLLNLLDNALRHTPPEGQVTLAAVRMGEEVHITVADTGEGIAPEHLPHLGERFYRADTARTRQHGGTGLGLSICRGIVAAHGGSLTIDSNLGRGTTVTVVLPVGEGEDVIRVA